MPILKNITNPNGALLGFHKALRAEVDLVAGTALAHVASWSTEQAHNDGLGLAWMWPVAVPLSQVTAIDIALTNMQDSPFLGGSIVADASEGLDAVKQRKWAQIKAERERRCGEPVTTAAGTFDCTPASRANLTSVAVMLMNAPGADPVTKFTLADNRRLQFTRSQLVQAALTVGARVQAQFDAADDLRRRINQATTIQEVETVSW